MCNWTIYTDVLHKLFINLYWKSLSDTCIALASLTNDFNHTLLHRGGIQAAVGGAPHYLIQQEVNKVFI